VVDGAPANVAIVVVVVWTDVLGGLVDAFGPQPATSAPARMPNAAVRLSRIEQKLGNLAQEIQGAIVPDRSLPPRGWWSAGEQAATRRRQLDGAARQAFQLPLGVMSEIVMVTPAQQNQIPRLSRMCWWLWDCRVPLHAACGQTVTRLVRR
jgi:hypothetical protein